MLVPDSTCLLSSTIVPVSCYIHPDMHVYDQSSQLIQTHTPRLKCRPTFIIPLEQWYCSHQGQFSPPLMTARSLPILRVATAGPTQGWHQRLARRSYVTAICKLNMTNRFPTSPLATSGPLRRKTERWTRRRSSTRGMLRKSTVVLFSTKWTHRRSNKEVSGLRCTHRWLRCLWQPPTKCCFTAKLKSEGSQGDRRWEYDHYFHWWPFCSHSFGFLAGVKWFTLETDGKAKRARHQEDKVLPHVEGMKKRQRWVWPPIQQGNPRCPCLCSHCVCLCTWAYQ